MKQPIEINERTPIDLDHRVALLTKIAKATNEELEILAKITQLSTAKKTLFLPLVKKHI